MSTKQATWKFNPNSRLGYGKLTTSRGRVLAANIDLAGAIRDYPEFTVTAEGTSVAIALHRTMVEGFFIDADTVLA